METPTLDDHLQSLLVQELSQVIDARSPDLAVMAASDAWAGMFRAPGASSSSSSPSTLKGQLGTEVFSDFKNWLRVFLSSPDSRGSRSRWKTARYRRLSGKDVDGLWFKAHLVVTVPRPCRETPDGRIPVVLSLEKKKRTRRAPKGSLHQVSGCPTILEEVDPDEETDSTATSGSRSGSRSSSNSSDRSYDGRRGQRGQRARPRERKERGGWRLKNWPASFKRNNNSDVNCDTGPPASGSADHPASACSGSGSSTRDGSSGPNGLVLGFRGSSAPPRRRHVVSL